MMKAAIVGPKMRSIEGLSATARVPSYTFCQCCCVSGLSWIDDRNGKLLDVIEGFSFDLVDMDACKPEILMCIQREGVNL